jgi:sortase (surface protein transpeptidase)
MYADYQICLMYGHPELQKQFNEYHNAEAGDELYFEVE